MESAGLKSCPSYPLLSTEALLPFSEPMEWKKL